MAIKFEGVMLAKKFEPRKHDVTGWWMSEKLDGVRAFWDGENFLSRTGKVFHAPDWYKIGLPKDRAIDGELYMGRGRFQDTVSVVRSHKKDKQWYDVTYAVFDAPSTLDFEGRLFLLRRYMREYKYGLVLPQLQVASREAMYEYCTTIQTHGGEGICLRAPHSPYVYKRSPMLLKIKGCIDGVADVYGTQAGEGKHTGRMGALLCQDRETGVHFKIGTGFSDAERERDWTGVAVRWEAHELTRDGIPRHSRYVTDWQGD